MSPSDESKAAEFLKGFFGKDLADTATKPKTTDEPNISLFMIQLIRRYSRLASSEPMAWEKTFRNKDNGREYTVTVTLREET